MRVPFTTSSIIRPSCRPFLVQIQIRQYSSQLTITDPLIIYQNLVDSDLLKPDESQFRAAVEYLLPQQLCSPTNGRLQKLSKRLRDYVPPDTFSRRIEELSSLLSEVVLQS
jgi:hypothetical protein